MDGKALLRAEGGGGQGLGAGILPLPAQRRLFVQKLQVREVMEHHQRAAALVAADLSLGQLRAHLIRLSRPVVKVAILTGGDGAVKGGERSLAAPATAEG